MKEITWYLLRRVVRVLFDYIEYSLGSEKGRTPEQMLDDIRHIRKDYTL